MKKIWLVLFVLVCEISFGQIINFPDPNFKKALLKSTAKLNASNFYTSADQNSDGEIDVNEANQVTSLFLFDQDIISIEGINFFKNIKELDCYNNLIEGITLTNLFKLKHLNCSNCKLTKLILINTPEISSFYCTSNKLKSLQLNGLNKLKTFWCYNNELEQLNIKTEALYSVEYDYKYDRNPNLTYICCDPFNVDIFKQKNTEYGLNACEVNSYCSFLPSKNYLSLFGKIEFNQFNNNCVDGNTPLSNIFFSVTSEGQKDFLISNFTGSYFIPLLEGNHTIKPILSNSEYYNVSPDSIAVAYPSTSDTIIQNFCITPKEVLRQVDITILPLSPPARPGFTTQYKVVVTNKGNQVESNTLYFSYDESILDFLKAEPNPSTQGSGLLSWDFTNLLPFESRSYVVNLQVNKPTDTPSVNVGDVLKITASILDNVFILENTVVGSFDPNDKTCLEGDKITTDMIGKYVHYLIRFENTGTYAAENIVVKDIIDETMFDVSSLEITDASHRSYARINNNIVEFIFEKIDLPFNDEYNDGYIAFKIKTRPTLKLGDEIKNKASIYFDYNFPIITNEAKSLITMVSSIQNNEPDSELKFYPNPTGDFINISTSENVIKAEIYDISGRILYSGSVENNQVDVKSLAVGTYVVKVFSKEGIRIGKLMKE